MILSEGRTCCYRVLSHSMCFVCADSAVTGVMRVLVALCVCAPRVLIRRRLGAIPPGGRKYCYRVPAVDVRRT